MQTPTPWIPHRIEFEDEWLKMKTSYQEEIDTNNEQEEVKKEESREDQYNRMGQGKCSPVSIAANQVTLKETVDSRSKGTPITNRGKDHPHQTREHRRRILCRPKHSRRPQRGGNTNASTEGTRLVEWSG
jgi:hypothetical protein